MPATITFWQTSEDEEDFLTYLRKTGPVVAVATGSGGKVQTPELAVHLAAANPSQIFFGRADLLESPACSLPDQEARNVSLMGSCLLAYRRGHCYDGNTLHQSTVAGYWDYPSADRKELIRKDAEFVKWGKAVLAHLRRVTPERYEMNGYGYRITRRAKDLVVDGKVLLAP